MPRVADVLAPLLHSQGWAGHLQAWATAAIADVPAVNGVPDEAARRALLQVLVTLPDPCPPTGMNLDLITALRDGTTEFARTCRRMQSVADFDTEAYNWS